MLQFDVCLRLSSCYRRKARVCQRLGVFRHEFPLQSSVCRVKAPLEEELKSE